ncbi:MAG: hypothetical protein U0U67_16695 [Chitinophagales bacterium]
MQTTEAYRNEYRVTEISKNYSGKLHFAFTSIWCLVLIAACIYFIHQPTWKELLIIPITFLYINLAEYFGHKGPLHNRKKRLDKVFKRHTLQHHRFFTNDNMQCDSVQDFKVILFPPVLILFFFIAFVVPVGLLFYFLWSVNAALIFVATAFVYFLNYEYLHLAYHLPDTHFIARLPIIKTFKRLHQAYHDPKLMNSKNFNISYPIFDFIFGTLH